ncbi:hypothetical protein [Litchfieldia alkalitelluris]|uniref:hypothetical protein n=1 Tax=Litchfieldia alkalitelluris TaxID=304268 RepID=UPI0009981D7B|nr:hypothetical protein [Litchfieldia alkalitelluris]
MNQLLKQIIKYNGFLKPIQKELNLSLEEIDEKLKSVDLDKNSKRRIFCWEVQLLAEQMVYENPSVHNVDLNDLVVKHWNSTHDLKISKEIISEFFDRSLIANDKQKHAFNALCSGSIESYKVYSDEDPTLFSELLIRVLLYLVKGNQVKKIYNQLLEHVFDRSALAIGKKTLSRLDFYIYTSGKPLVFNIESLVKNIPLQSAVFADGIISILLPIAEQLKEQEESMQVLYDALINYQSSDEEAEVVTEVAAEEKTDVSVEESHQNDISTSTGHQAVERNELTVQEQIEDYAKKIIDLSSQLTQPELPEKEVEETENNQLKELELENQRLYRHLERLQQEKEQVQYKKLFDLFDGIAGKKSQYLLSEMFDEITQHDDSSMLAGKMKNFFNYLRMAGIEPTTYGLDLGEEFDITKEALKDKFTLTSPLTSQAEKVTIKILKRGWSIEGKTIIFPLAEEVVAVTQN